MKIYDTIESIKQDISEKLPELLADCGVSDFDKYAIGYPTDQDKLFCCVRFSERKRDTSEEFSFIIHLQLPGVTETEAYKYLDSVSAYLDGGLDMEVGYSLMVVDNFNIGLLEAFFEATNTMPLDDCD
jgi:hypothetical protein